MKESAWKSFRKYCADHSWVRIVASGIALFCIIWIGYDILVPLSRAANDNLQTVRTAMIVLPILCLAAGCYLRGKGTLTPERTALLLLLAGFSLRIGYAFYTGVNCRQHDVEMYGSDGLNLTGSGHFTYTYILYSTMRLPESVTWQFYHPPLWHFSVAVWMHIYSFFEGTTDIAALYDAGTVLSSFVGCLTLYGFRKLIFRITDRNPVRLVALALIAFHPQFFIISGWMNNEGMALMFSVFALYFGLCFHQDRGWRNILWCGLCLGLGAMSKVSVALICIPLAIFFIADWIRDIREGKWKKTTLQYASFIAVVAPLALWFLIRNYLKFGISSLGVPGIDPSSSMGVIQYSYWQRFGFFHLSDLFRSPYCILRPNADGYLDYNVWIYTIKCSVLGEYSYWQGECFILLLLIFNCFIMIYSLFSMITVLISDRKGTDGFLHWVLFVIFVVSVGSYLIFQITNPVTCTQDFRYMTMVLLPGTYFVARRYDNLKHLKFGSVRRVCAGVVIFGFIVCAVLTFISVR